MFDCSKSIHVLLFYYHFIIIFIVIFINIFFINILLIAKIILGIEFLPTIIPSCIFVFLNSFLYKSYKSYNFIVL